MKTNVYHIPCVQGHEAEIEGAAQVIREGGLVAIPTETVYGLGADALNEKAVAAIYEAKGRPSDNPLIIHVPGAHWLERYCVNVPQAAYDLAEQFWPGPLTMILPRKDNVPDRTTGGLDTVGVRCPDHPVTLAIIEAAGVPIAAPSANTSGRPSCTNAQDVLEDMNGKIPAIVDGGPCAVGVESTILDLTVTPPQLLRPGGMPLEALEGVVGEIAVDHAVTGQLKPDEKPRAPGMKYRHYAPHAKVTVLTGDGAKTAAYIREKITPGAGVICFDEYAELFPDCITHCLGPEGDKAEQARRVFDALREFDHTDVTEIYAQCPDDTGLGLAIGNRLKKAAGFHVVNLKREREHPMKIIGITGGTGAGKTSALHVLAEMNVEILDCDVIYHQLIQTSQALRTALTERFGDVFCADGLDRQKLGNLVFQNPDALAQLNVITMGFVEAEVHARMKRAEAAHRIGVAIDAIGLLESDVRYECDVLVAITAPAEVRCKRIMAREGIGEEYAWNRVKAQKDEGYFKENCDYVLPNDSTEEVFRMRAVALFTKVLNQ